MSKETTADLFEQYLAQCREDGTSAYVVVQLLTELRCRLVTKYGLSPERVDVEMERVIERVLRPRPRPN
jgi:hypothetical protein